MQKRSSDPRASNDLQSESGAPGRLMAPKRESALLLAFAQGVGGAGAVGTSPDSSAGAQGGEGEIPLAEHFRLLRQLTETSRDETLHLSKRPLAPGTTDFVIDMLLQAKNFEDAMKRTARAYNLMHGDYYNRVNRRIERIVYTINDERFPYAFDLHSGGAYALMEGLLIFLHALLSLSVGEGLTQYLRCVRTRRPSRAAPDGFLEFWDAPVRCGASAYALEYDVAALSLPLQVRPGAPPNAVAVYDLIDTMIAARERSGLNKSMPSRVLETIAEGVDNQGDVARRLGVSIATLRRRLSEAGTSFRALRGQALNEAAVSMLRQGRPIGDVAEALGYVDIRSFSRAFKAWNGVTPTAFAASSAAGSRASEDRL